jgi:hypothetical protein
MLLLWNTDYDMLTISMLNFLIFNKLLMQCLRIQTMHEKYISIELKRWISKNNNKFQVLWGDDWDPFDWFKCDCHKPGPRFRLDPVIKISVWKFRFDRGVVCVFYGWLNCPPWLFSLFIFNQQWKEIFMSKYIFTVFHMIGRSMVNERLPSMSPYSMMLLCQWKILKRFIKH